jgi:hypothetical protein
VRMGLVCRAAELCVDFVWANVRLCAKGEGTSLVVCVVEDARLPPFPENRLFVFLSLAACQLGSKGTRWSFM